MPTSEFDPDWVVHPGSVVLELMCVEWVHGTDVDAQVLERFVLGEQELTDEIKALLVRRTGVSAQFWENHEHTFRRGLAAGKKWER